MHLQLMPDLRKFDHAKKGNLPCPLNRARVELLIATGLLRPHGSSIEVTNIGRSNLEKYSRMFTN